MTMKPLTIGRVARQAGVNVETIRYYERRGLIEQPRRPDRSFRQYSPDIIKRVRFIREAQELGFSLREVANLLALRTDPAANCEDVSAQATAKRKEVRDKIKKLQRMDAALASLIADCPKKGALVDCPIIAALDRDH